MSDGREPWEGYLRLLTSDVRGDFDFGLPARPPYEVGELLSMLGSCTDCGAVVPKANAEFHRSWHTRADEAWGDHERRLDSIEDTYDSGEPT